MTENKVKRVSRVREMKNDLILDAALKVFAESGFHNTRLEDIAQEAGFSKASLYNYYKDKEEIFLSLGAREYQRISERLESDPLLRIDEALPLKENLRRILTLVFTTFGRHFAFVLTLNSFQFLSVFHESDFHTGNNSENEFVDARCCVDGMFVDLVKNAQSRGEIRSDISAEQLHTYFDALIFATIREWHRSQKMGDITATIDSIVSFIAEGYRISL